MCGRQARGSGDVISGTMQNVFGDLQDQIRQGLLDQMTDKEEIRSHIKRDDVSVLVIQRIWRGRTVARKFAAQVRAEWDEKFLSRHPENKSSISADVISNQLLRPLFMILKPSSPFGLHQIAEDAGRLATCFRLLLQSIHNPDMRFNYCNLSVGSPEDMSKWMYQARELLRLACAALQKESFTNQKLMKRNHLALVDSGLARISIQVMASLTDSNAWRCFDGSEQEVRKRKADILVLSLFEWLACESSGFFLAARSYILENFLVPWTENQEARHYEKEDNTFITVMLRPLLALCAECSKITKGAENSKDYRDYKSAAERAAALFSMHILTIPFLTQRLPQPLLPALEGPLVLSPCLGYFEILPRNPPQIGTTTSALPRLPSLQGIVDSELVGVPPSAWALSNVVCLASHTVKHNTPFMNGSTGSKYVQALRCLLEDMNEWIETMRKKREAEKNVSEAEGDKDVNNRKGVEIENEISKSSESIAIQMLVKSLSPLHQQWHLEKLAQKAIFNESNPMKLINAAKRSLNSAEENLFDLSDVAKIYFILLQVFAVLNPFGGALPILNLIAFTPLTIPQLWDWLHSSPSLAHLLRLNVQEKENTRRQLETKATLAKKTAPIGRVIGFWTATSRLIRKPIRHYASLQRTVSGRTETSSSSGIRSYRSDSCIDPELSRRWAAEIREMRGISNSPSRVGGSSESLGILKSIGDNTMEDDVPAQITDMDNVKNGSRGVPKEVLPVLLLFCEAYSHFLFVLDDEDFYERQELFSLEQQKVISGLLNTLVYNELSTYKRSTSLLIDVASKCVKFLYERDCRRSFCPPWLWIAPAAAIRSPSGRAAADASQRSSSKPSQVAALGLILRTIPHVLSFKERVHIFREFVQSDKSRKVMEGGTVCPVPGTIEITVKRENLFEDALAILNPSELRSKSCINVSFENKSGLAAAGLHHGGSLKGRLTDLAKTGFDPEYGLFVQTSTDGLLLPSAAAGNLDYDLQKFEILGKIVGLALYEGILLECSFSPLFISNLFGRYSFLEDLSNEDPELHRKLVHLKRSDEDAQDLELKFTVKEEDRFGDPSSVDLQHDGAHIPVTNENKLHYVYAVVNYKLNRRMKPVTDAFARGMKDWVDPGWLGIFSAKEFNQLVSGEDHAFNVDDLRAHTCYTNGYTIFSQTIKIFWEVVQELEEEERSALLKFVTGCSRPPLLGFEYLQPAFTIERVPQRTSAWALIFGQDVDCLPTASICTNTLKLPMYKRASFLKEKLKFAMKSSSRS